MLVLMENVVERPRGASGAHRAPARRRAAVHGHRGADRPGGAERAATGRTRTSASAGTASPRRARVKDGAPSNDMLDRLAADPRVGRSPAAEMQALLDPLRFVGRAPRAGGRVPGRSGRAAARGAAPPAPPARRCAYDASWRSPHFRCATCAAARCARCTRSDPTACSSWPRDRVSAFDVVMDEPIPYKGAVLTQITAWWLRQFEAEVHHHMVSRRRRRDRPARARPRRSPPDASPAAPCSAAAPRYFPIECVVRGYLSGSAWKEYREHGHPRRRAAAGGAARERPVRRGRSSARPRRPSPATTRTSRSPTSRRRLGADVGDGARAAQPSRLRARPRRSPPSAASSSPTPSSSSAATPPARSRSIDEVLTPDSSRFWPADQYTPGRTQPSFDKQPLRDYLDGERRAGRWNGDAPPPPLPARRRTRHQRALPRRIPPDHRRAARHWRACRELRPRRLRRSSSRPRSLPWRRTRWRSIAGRGRSGCWRSCSRCSRSGWPTSSATRSARARAATRS